MDHHPTLCISGNKIWTVFLGLASFTWHKDCKVHLCSSLYQHLFFYESLFHSIVVSIYQLTDVRIVSTLRILFCGCWKLNRVPLQEHQTLSTSLQSKPKAFEELLSDFSNLWRHVTTLPVTHDGPNVSSTSPALGIVCMFYRSHPKGCRMLSHCDFTAVSQ